MYGCKRQRVITTIHQGRGRTTRCSGTVHRKLERWRTVTSVASYYRLYASANLFSWDLSPLGFDRTNEPRLPLNVKLYV